ncbi:Sperm flagellar protein 2 [Chelonia mydas]|uniref:Sperm flagellar protein 2 n=1 Tax=Chelonia mydas TaxID=8469 RepID=M7BIE1_CHEMY|nr:Sperm flagellar protein 2 [Chelonia mydas]
MSEILCEWLNWEVKLSQTVDPKSFPKEFSTGYLIGEILHKYELQDDFNQFSQSRVANSKLNNFSRLEPTLQLLGVQFDQNEAQNIMTEQHGAATKLLYQLYVALEKKKKTGLTGVAMEAMRPAAPAKLQGIESELYRERLRNLMPRQTDLRLQQVSEHFEMKSKHMQNKIARMQFAEQQKVQKIQEEQRAQDIEKHRKGRRRQNEIMARIQAAIIQIPKPPPNRTLKAIEAQKLLKKKKEAEDVYMEIKKFETFMRKESPTSGSTQVTDSTVQDTLQIQELDITAPDTTAQTTTELLSTYSDDEYIRKIQKRLEEDSFAREQREKRRRKMLMEQLIAHEAQEALAKQEKIDYEEHICKERDLHEKIAAERAEARYKKHYSMCWEVIDQIIDLSTKTGEYRMLTNNLIPIKLMRDWKELFFNGKPIYEQALIEPLPTDPTPEQLVELDKMNLLDETDYDEYKSMIGEWCPPEEHSGSKPPPNNNILGHVVHRLMDIVYPPTPEPPPPVFPPFPIQGCVLGKLFSGKSTCVKFLEEACNIQVLSIDTLVQDTIKAFHESEMKSESRLILREAEGSGKQNEVSASFILVLTVIRNSGADKSGSSQIQLEDSDQASDVELKEREKIDLVRDQIQHRFVIFSTVRLYFSRVLKHVINFKHRAVRVYLTSNDTVHVLKVKDVLKKFAEVGPKYVSSFIGKELKKKESEKKQEVPTPLPQAEMLTVPADKNKETESPSEDKEPMPAKSKSPKGSVRGKSPGKKSSPATPEDVPPPTPVGPPPIKPGSDKWVYIDEPLPKVTAEIQSKEAEEEKERQQLEKKEQERQKPSQAAGGKGGGKDAKDAKKPPPKSPTKKKDVPSPAPVAEATAIPLTPEELKKQELKLKMKQEYFSALEYEEEAAKSRLQLIKTKALTFVEELVMKAEETYKYMEKWLGARFLAEMSRSGPKERLVDAVTHFHGHQLVGNGNILAVRTKVLSNLVGLWFKGSEDLKMPENSTEPLPFNRQEHLITVTIENYKEFKFFFILFADARKDPSQLDYTKMLLYFASHPDAVEGVYRALSIATGTYIHRRKEVSPPHVSLSHTDMLIKEEPLVEKEKILYCTDEGRISMATLQRVFHHEGSKSGDNHRFSDQQKAGSNNKLVTAIWGADPALGPAEPLESSNCGSRAQQLG